MFFSSAAFLDSVTEDMYAWKAGGGYFVSNSVGGRTRLPRTAIAAAAQLGVSQPRSSVSSISLASYLASIQRLLRHFPYTEMLAVFMPVYALLWAQTAVSPVAVWMMAPFVCAFAAGFIFNDMHDLADPGYKANPLLMGTLTRSQTQYLLAGFVALSVLSFFELYHSLLSRGLFIIYWFLGLAYSGLGIRFKERVVGPFVASFVIWTAGPFIVSVEFGIVRSTGLILAGTWLIYVGREIHHMISDYGCDLRTGYRTLAVRIGIARGRLWENGLFAGGSLCLIGDALSRRSLGHVLNGHYPALLTVLLVGAILTQAGGNPPSNARETRAAYRIVRLALIVFAVWFLKLAPIPATLAVWAFVTSARS
jgi:hypothetical protein